MQTIIAGRGKLASELLASLEADDRHTVVRWAGKDSHAGKSVVVHAGSGRELQDLSAYCEATHSPLIELASGSNIESASIAFPVVLCPNTNILMLKFLSMLEQSGRLFHGYSIDVVESHQASKTTVPGTAVSIALALDMNRHDIRSVRDTGTQSAELQIPAAHFARHAYHQVLIQDGQCSLKLETRVYGEAPYAQGVTRIVQAARSRELDNRLYSITEFISNGWL